ncbi:glutamate--tRNA ligase family protein, partial [Acinetobacter schindleri]|uniref:glutamate--tRNA ligase family protein n=1 Tax=Acinetobacter schindleri TaxID=108981 RepID=UPI00241DBC44
MTVENSSAEHSSLAEHAPHAQRRNDVSLTRYSGRFAPSPTGPLHFGSLITAVASYCDARAHQGQWLVRIEDTDIPRIYPGSEDHILRAMDVFGFDPDAAIIFQKDRLDIYDTVIEQLRQQGLVYACQCTRKMLGSNHIYQDTCRDLGLAFGHQAIRLKVEDVEICFDD